jgi:hypothetical protein
VVRTKNCFRFQRALLGLSTASGVCIKPTFRGSLMMGTDMIFETSVLHRHRTQLLTREDFIEFCRRERPRSYVLDSNSRDTHTSVLSLWRLINVFHCNLSSWRSTIKWESKFLKGTLWRQYLRIRPADSYPTVVEMGSACVIHRILLGWLNQGEWGGLDMWHAWEREEGFTGFWFGGPKGRDHWEDLGVGGRITSNGP